MAVCSFLGHRYICDPNVRLRLQAAVNQVVEENDSVEFLRYTWGSKEPFYDLCLLTALRARQCAPPKSDPYFGYGPFRTEKAFGGQPACFPRGQGSPDFRLR